MGLLDELRKRRDALVAQVNPFDQGRTYNTVRQSQGPAPAPRMAQSTPVRPVADTRSGFSKVFDQLNILDSGRTFKDPIVKPEKGSLLRQLTHNAVANTAGNIVKPFSNVVAGTVVEPAREEIAKISGNRTAEMMAGERAKRSLEDSALGIIGKSAYYTGKMVPNLGAKVIAEEFGTPTEVAVADRQFFEDLNKSPIGQFLNIPQRELAEYQANRDLKGATPDQRNQAVKETLSSIGIDPDQNLFQQAAVTVGGGAQLAAPTWGFTKSLVKAGIPRDVLETTKTTTQNYRPSEVVAKAAKEDPEWRMWEERVAYANEQAAGASTAAERAKWNEAVKQMMDNRNRRFKEIAEGGYAKAPGRNPAKQAQPRELTIKDFLNLPEVQRTLNENPTLKVSAERLLAEEPSMPVSKLMNDSPKTKKSEVVQSPVDKPPVAAKVAEQEVISAPVELLERKAQLEALARDPATRNEVLEELNAVNAQVEQVTQPKYNAGRSKPVAEARVRFEETPPPPPRGTEAVASDGPLGPEVPLKERGFIKSVRQSPEVSEQVRKGVTGNYIPSSLNQAAVNAEQFARGPLARRTLEVKDSLAKKEGTLTDQEVANAIAVAKRLDAQLNEAGHDAAQAIYDRLAEHGTAGGQQINAFRLLSNRTPDGMKFHILRDLKGKGVELSKDEMKQLNALIGNVRKTKPSTRERDMAVHEVAKFGASKIPTGVGERAVNLWRAGLLTSPITTGGNILGNVTEATTRNLWTNPVAAGADWIMSLATGKRTKTLQGGQAPGVGEGLSKAGTYLKTGFDERNARMKYDQVRKVNYKYGPVDKYVESVYRWMGGQDQPFYYAAKRQATQDLALADAKNLGLKGAERDEYIAGALSNPDWKPQTFQTRKGATEAGKFAVYQDETALGQAAVGAKRAARQFNDVAGAITDFILPFTQVPASVATRIFARTPLGVASEVARQFLNVRRGRGFDQRAMAEAVGNGTFAPGVMAVGYSLGQNGLITGGWPADLKEQELWRLEGRQPNSVKIGDRWYSLNYMQPFGTLMAIGGQMSSDINQGKSPEEAWLAAAGTAAKSVESQSFLQGVNNLLTFINEPDRSAGKYIATTTSSLVPNVVRTTARATDPNQRESKSALAGVQSAIPGASRDLPAKQDAFGRPLPAKDTWYNQLFNPLRPSRALNTNDATIDELRRLQNADKGIVPTQFDKGSFDSKTYGNVKITPEQTRQLQEQFGKELKPVWDALIHDSRYKQLSDDDKQTALKSAADTVSDAVKRNFAVNNQIAINKGASAKTVAFSQGQTPDFLGGVGTGFVLNSKLNKEAKQVIGQFGGMNDDQRDQAFRAENGAEYRYKLALWQNKNLNKSLSKAEDIRAQKELAKLKAGSIVSKDIRELYSLPKGDIYNLISSDPEGENIANELQKLDQALYGAGLVKYAKFRNGFAPSGGRGGRSGGNAKGYGKINKNNLSGFEIGKAKSSRSLVAASTVETPSGGSRSVFRSKAPSGPPSPAAPKIARVKYPSRRGQRV